MFGDRERSARDAKGLNRIDPIPVAWSPRAGGVWGQQLGDAG